MDGDQILRGTVERLNINLAQLVAETSVWVNPRVFYALKSENAHGVWYQNTRRFKQGKGEKPGKIVDGVRLDNNSYANTALKQALGLEDLLTNFMVCHIWEESCYDPRHHTCVANLVLVPRAISCLTDYDELTKLSLQYRAFELYGWYPTEKPQPEKPQGYPETWNEPLPISKSVEAALRRKRLVLSAA